MDHAAKIHSIHQFKLRSELTTKMMCITRRLQSAGFVEDGNMKVTATGLIWQLCLISTLSLSPFLAQGDSTYHKDGALSWPNHGGGIFNRREAAFETKINTESVKALSLKWTVHTNWDVSDSPSIDAEGGFVYFSSWDGCVYAATLDSGELVWKVNISEIAPTIPGLVEGIFVIPFLKGLATQYGGSIYANVANLLSRATPTIAGPLLVFGLEGPCYVLALNRTSGALVWWSSINSHPYCVVTQSATYYKGGIYIGISSEESSSPPATCCTFQGAFFKLDIKTGQILWKVPMLPDNHNQTGLYAGAAVWGSSPSIDTRRNLVYIGTGNAYSTPPSAEACELARLNRSSPNIPDPCIVEGDYQESLLAINLDDGKVWWARNLGGYDTWTMPCSLSPHLPTCPAVLGPDSDFGEAPFLFTTKDNRDLVVAAQKNGIVHALDRSTGAVVWQTVAGPREPKWGMATDGERVFLSISNSMNVNFTLLPSSKVITWGGFVGINGTTGAILWSTANPEPYQTNAPVAYANGVVFGASDGNVTTNSPSGKILALDAETGEVLWSYGTEGTIGGGAAIVDGCIYQPIGGTLSSLGFISSYYAHGRSTIALCVPS